VVVVPVAGVSRLAQRAISGALSISDNVIAVAVVTGDDSPAAGRDGELQEQWASSVSEPVCRRAGSVRPERWRALCRGCARRSLRPSPARSSRPGSGMTASIKPPQMMMRD
jgi:hypothetical protein